MCALVHVLHSDSEPTGVPPFTNAFPITLTIVPATRWRGLLTGKNREQSVLYPSELLELDLKTGLPRQDSNLRPAVYEVTVTYATGEIAPVCQRQKRAPSQPEATPQVRDLSPNTSVIRELAKRVSEQESRGTWYFGATPPSRKPHRSGRVFRPCSLSRRWK